MVLLSQLLLLVGCGFAWQESTFALCSRVMVVNRRGCRSRLGFDRPENEDHPNSTQNLSINARHICLAVIGITVHEFLHALGLIHSHQRTDRDHYISISDKDDKLSFLNITPYDNTSYMHYLSFPNGAEALKVPTMVTKDKRYRKTIDNLRGSFYDFYAINEYYKCNEKCPSNSSAKCANGGTPHPRDCNTCLCPSEFGGQFCDERPGTCGKTFFAASRMAKSMLISMGVENKKREFAPTTCVHWIEAPPGHRVEIMFSGVKEYGHGNRTKSEKESCRLNGIEFKINKNPRLGGPIFCDRDDWGINLASDLNPAPLIIFNYEGKQVYHILYKAVPIQNVHE